MQFFKNYTYFKISNIKFLNNKKKCFYCNTVLQKFEFLIFLRPRQLVLIDFRWRNLYSKIENTRFKGQFFFHSEKKKKKIPPQPQ